MYGIKLNNLSFNGINIGQLYLKYDKKLFLQMSDLDYQGKILDFNLSVGRDEQKYIVDIENFYYQNLQMNFSGKLILSGDDIEKLQSGIKKDLTLLDTSVIFDQNIAPVLAEKLFVQFPNDISLRFFRPTLDGVKLDNSTIDIVDMAKGGVLKVYLDIDNMLDLRVLKVLGNYEVDLPLKQVGGETHTTVKIDIPFSKDKEIVIIADAKVQNGVITIGDNHLNVKQTPPNPNSKTKVKVHVELVNNRVIFEDYTFHSDNLYVDYHDKMVEISSKQNKIEKSTQTLANIENINAKLQDKILKYKVDVKDTKANFITLTGNTNLNVQKTQGVIHMNHLGYENKAVINGEKLSFLIAHKPFNVTINGDFGIDIKMEDNATKRVGFRNFISNFKNNVANISTNIEDGNNSFSLKNNTNLDHNITKGTILIGNYNLGNSFYITNQTLHYLVKHNPLVGQFRGDIELLLKDKENHKDKKITFDNLVARYEKNEATIDANIKENQNKLTLHNKISLDKNISIGTIFVNSFQYEDKIKLENQTLKYQVKHEPMEADVSGDVVFTYGDKEKSKEIALTNFVLHYLNNIATIHSDIQEGNNQAFLANLTDLDKNISNGTLFVKNFQYEDVAKLHNQTLKYEVEHEPLKAHITSDLKATLQNKETILNGLDILFLNNILNVKTNYLEGNNSAFLTNTTNLDDKSSKGTLELKRFQFDKYLDLKNEFLKYSVDFKDGVKVIVPKYLLTYKKDEENKQNLFIGRLNPLLDKVNFVASKKLNDGTLYLSTPNEFKETNIIINDLGVDINSSLFVNDSKQDNNKTIVAKDKNSTDLPKISLKMFNSKVTVDGYNLNSTSIVANTNKQEIDLKYLPEDENSTIKFNKNGDNLHLRADNLSGRFIENFLKKDIVDKGTFTITVDGNETNLYGGIYAKDTNIKNVRILNNLITFINTTPAIITPILALPTLFRMSETEFDMTGYPIRSGHVNFDYQYDTKMLTFPSFYTRSKMMDFRGKGYVDIANQKLGVGIDVIFLKDYSKFFNHIPVLGYIITGDDGNFVTNVDINGTFEKQEFTTHAIENAAEGAENMVKRTFMTPFRLFEKIKFEPIKDTNTTDEDITQKEGN